MLFAHDDWVSAGIFEKMAERAATRNLDDYTCVPVLTWNNDKIKAHQDKILAIPGAKLLFGGKPL